MFLKTMTMLLCTASVAFYMRFLVALWKDRNPSLARSFIGCACVSTLARRP